MLERLLGCCDPLAFSQVRDWVSHGTWLGREGISSSEDLEELLLPELFPATVSPQALTDYKVELRDDPIINTHLAKLYDNLLEQNLIRVIEPFSRVQVNVSSSTWTGWSLCPCCWG